MQRIACLSLAVMLLVPIAVAQDGSPATSGAAQPTVALPRINAARFLMTRFDAGLFREGGSWLHVSRGLGTSVQPVRVGVPREIAVLTLVPDVASAAAS